MRRIVTVRFPVLALLCLVVAALSAAAQQAVPPTARQAAASAKFARRLSAARAAAKSRVQGSAQTSPGSGESLVLYENGPLNGAGDAWTINFGYVVADSFQLGATAPVNGFVFYTWSVPGDTLLKVDWSITSQPFGGTTYASGTANITEQFISTNSYGFSINRETVSGLNVTGLERNKPLWLNLGNAVVDSGDPIWWDENFGDRCGGSDNDGTHCPSLAAESAVGTIPSESFEVDTSHQDGCTAPTVNYPQETACRVFPQGTGGRYKVQSPFQMAATFQDQQGLCEYRQAVRGFWLFYPPQRTWPVQLPYAISRPPQRFVDPLKLHEDGTANLSLNEHYGHRTDGVNMPFDEYLPTRDTGNSYAGAEASGITYSPSHPGTYDIMLDYRGEIIDKATQLPVTNTYRYWSTDCSVLVDAPGKESAATRPADLQLCKPLKQALVGATLQDGTPVTVNFSVCTQKPNELVAVVLIDHYDDQDKDPIKASEVNFRILSASRLLPLEAPSGLLDEADGMGTEAFGIYRYRFVYPLRRMLVRLAVRGSSVEIPITLKPPQMGPLPDGP